VGLPRLSRISRPMMSTMAVMGALFLKKCRDWTVGAASTATHGGGKGREPRDDDIRIG
jgi:hypothetical protein